MKITLALRRARPFAVLAIACGFALLGSSPSASAASLKSATKTNPKHFFWSNGATPNPSAATNDLIYHGGNAGPGAIGVEKTPTVYLVYWGAPWAAGFTTPDSDGTAFSSSSCTSTIFNPPFAEEPAGGLANILISVPKAPSEKLLTH